MAKPDSRLAVLGAGVIGLSTAIVAQREGWRTTIYTAQAPELTTSAKAAASFKPHEVAYNDLAHRLVLESQAQFFRVIADFGTEATGVRRQVHWEASSAPKPAPAYLVAMEDAEMLERPDVPGGYAYGWRYTTFFIDTSIYIGWLASVFEAGGGALRVLPGPLGTIEDVETLEEERIVNCTGLGARRLCRDDGVRPIKGQIAVVDPLPGMDWSISADGFYVYPRSRDTVLGGTVERDCYTEDVDSGAAYLLVQGNRRIVPSLVLPDVRRVYAGLRPYRDGSIRLETEPVGDKLVVHSYGHGGAGITLSWGSAMEAVKLL